MTSTLCHTAIRRPPPKPGVGVVYRRLAFMQGYENKGMVSIPWLFMPLFLCAVLCRCSRWLSCVLSFCVCTARVFIHSLSAPLYRPLSLRSAIVPLSWPVLCWPSVYLLPLPVRCIAGFAPCWPCSAMLLCTAYHRCTFPTIVPACRTLYNTRYSFTKYDCLL